MRSRSSKLVITSSKCLKKSYRAHALKDIVRQILRQQGNRNFARGALITEKSVRLLHFDRTGTYITPFFNYHNDPYTFIRLVLGLTSTDEATLGLDTSIQWVIKNGRKFSGTMKILPSPDDEAVPYDLIDVNPIFSRSSICGRGTTCWLVKQSIGKNVLIKDAWHTETRTAEHVYLEAAREVAAVPRMICYKTLGQTRDYRPDHYVSTATFHNRKKIRILMEAHGENLAKFSSRYELVAALRDVLRGTPFRVSVF